MAFEIGLEDGILRMRLTGILIQADLDGLAAEIAHFERGERAPDRLIDVRGLHDATVSFREMHELTQRRRAMVLPNAVRTAMLVASEVQRGFARMFQTLNDHPQVEIRIFDDERSARSWLSGEAG